MISWCGATWLTAASSSTSARSLPDAAAARLSFGKRSAATIPESWGPSSTPSWEVLQELPSVQPAELPRMADFAKFAEAVGRKLGWPAGTALADYNANRSDASLDRLEDSPLAAFLLDLSPDFFVNWSGTPSELLEELIALAR